LPNSMPRRCRSASSRRSIPGPPPSLTPPGRSMTPARNTCCAAKKAPLVQIIDARLVAPIPGGSVDNPHLEREPEVLVALGRWLFVPVLGSLLCLQDDPDEAAVHRDYAAIAKAVLATMPRRAR
jgi:hypothetical protein